MLILCSNNGFNPLPCLQGGPKGLKLVQKYFFSQKVRKCLQTFTNVRKRSLTFPNVTINAKSEQELPCGS